MSPAPAIPVEPAAPVRYDVTGELPGFTLGTLRDAASQAFALWAEETPLAFTRTAQNPEFTIRFTPLGTGGELGNALIEINSSLGWRYGPGRHQQASHDLVTVIGHEIGHRLEMNHSTDPKALMFESQSNTREVRTLAADDIRAVQQRYNAAVVVEATSVHGTSVAIEDPAKLVGIARKGPHARVEAANAAMWFHFAPTTPVRAEGKPLRLNAVRLKVQTHDRVALRLVHVWDGMRFLQVHRLDLRGDSGMRLWDLRLGVASKPIVTEGIGISLNVDFVNSGTRRIDFISAGCEFVSARSVSKLPDEVLDPD